MPTQIFVNLPVKALARSIEFFGRLGYRFDPRFTDDDAACMVVADDIFVMLLAEPFFQTFTPKPIVDATRATEVLICLSCDSREALRALVEKARAAGATTPMDAKDHGFMLQHGFQDLDGHLWELIHMEPGGMPEG